MPKSTPAKDGNDGNDGTAAAKSPKDAKDANIPDTPNTPDGKEGDGKEGGGKAVPAVPDAVVSGDVTQGGGGDGADGKDKDGEEDVPEATVVNEPTAPTETPQRARGRPKGSTGSAKATKTTKTTKAAEEDDTPKRARGRPKGTKDSQMRRPRGSSAAKDTPAAKLQRLSAGSARTPGSARSVRSTTPSRSRPGRSGRSRPSLNSDDDDDDDDSSDDDDEEEPVPTPRRTPHKTGISFSSRRYPQIAPTAIRHIQDSTPPSELLKLSTQFQKQMFYKPSEILNIAYSHLEACQYRRDTYASKMSTLQKDCEELEQQLRLKKVELELAKEEVTKRRYAVGAWTKKVFELELEEEGSVWNENLRRLREFVDREGRLPVSVRKSYYKKKKEKEREEGKSKEDEEEEKDEEKEDKGKTDGEEEADDDLKEDKDEKDDRGEEEKQLALWVDRIRWEKKKEDEKKLKQDQKDTGDTPTKKKYKMHKTRINAKTSLLAFPHRLAALSSLGVDFTPTHTSKFETMFQKLVTYKEEHGMTRFPSEEACAASGDKELIALQKWVKSQVLNFRYGKAGSRGKDPKIVKRFLDIGFSFEKYYATPGRVKKMKGEEVARFDKIAKRILGEEDEDEEESARRMRVRREDDTSSEEEEEFEEVKVPKVKVPVPKRGGKGVTVAAEEEEEEEEQVVGGVVGSAGWQGLSLREMELADAKEHGYAIPQMPMTPQTPQPPQIPKTAEDEESSDDDGFV